MLTVSRASSWHLKCAKGTAVIATFQARRFAGSAAYLHNGKLVPAVPVHCRRSYLNAALHAVTFTLINQAALSTLQGHGMLDSDDMRIVGTKEAKSHTIFMPHFLVNGSTTSVHEQSGPRPMKPESNSIASCGLL